jgi:hypothetical protein
MTDKQITTYCDDVKETALRQFYKIQNQRKEISLLHKKCAIQQAEIERLEGLSKHHQFLINELNIGIAELRAEAIKEFAEKLERIKRPRSLIFESDYMFTVTMMEIDNLVKEMVGEDK